MRTARRSCRSAWGSLARMPAMCWMPSSAGLVCRAAWRPSKSDPSTMSASRSRRWGLHGCRAIRVRSTVRRRSWKFSSSQRNESGYSKGIADIGGRTGLLRVRAFAGRAGPERGSDLQQLLCRRQGFVEYREHCGVASHIVYRGEATAEPAGWTDAFRHLVADAFSFSLVADKIVGGAVNRAHGAPLGSRVIVPVDMMTVRGASKGM